MVLSRRVLLGLGLSLPAGLAIADGTWPDALIMGTGRPGGYYTSYGPEWGRLAERSAGLDIAFRASGGAASNILLIEQNEVQLGMTTVTVATQARHGTGAWTGGVRFQAFRALFPMFPSILQIVSPQSTGITSLAGLAGRIIGIGPDGGSGAAAVPAIFASVGIIPAQVPTGDYEQQMRDMFAGKIAACAFIAAPPVPAITRAAMGRKLSLIGFSAAECAQVARTSPGMSPMVLQAGGFPGQDIAVASVGTMNFAIGAASLPDNIAQAVTLAALRNRADFAALVPAAAETPETTPILQGGIPFHPGAVDTLRDFGMRVPKSAVS